MLLSGIPNERDAWKTRRRRNYVRNIVLRLNDSRNGKFHPSSVHLKLRNKFNYSFFNRIRHSSVIICDLRGRSVAAPRSSLTRTDSRRQRVAEGNKRVDRVSDEPPVSHLSRIFRSSPIPGH